MCDPSELEAALVLENLSVKPITALRCRWMMTDRSGMPRKWLRGGDSFLNQPGKAMLEPHGRELMTPASQVQEETLELVLRPRGGGYILGGSGGRSIAGYSAAAFSIDFVLFEDGEIAGTDPDRYGAEMILRKTAAEFVAAQVRQAEAEKREPLPLLNALTQMPVMNDELMGRLIRDLASRLVHYCSRDDVASTKILEAMLRQYENILVPPKYYRKGT